ncbi:hypothetical protein FHS43_002517 [Streptosporangium becharense]|uniref:DNA methylase adenine-specific domain-containing protein n=1 Tax=Streptosporangium becharense TaxID=1816182 RepID=A0A7W9IJQ3_9ACTN|nr:hypothetical protein [Streptosporangium becharense]MBB2911252.1 hypothetical protein [Streptosporangium becharense]MBB5821690.1 hypothetical protein [Streptosporangium becharense]
MSHLRSTPPGTPDLCPAPLVSMAEIAAMAQVRRPVVSTWRRRYDDFPAAVPGSAGRPRFHSREVVDWLITSGLGNTDPARLRAEPALHSIAAHADRFGPRRLVEIVGSLLCLRHLDEKPLLPGASDDPRGDAHLDPDETWAALRRRAERMDAEDELVLRELRATDGSAVPLARLAEDLVEAAYTPAGAYEQLLAARARLGLAELTADALTPELLRLLVRLADPRSGVERHGTVTLADPHAGAGDLLAALVRAVEDPTMIRALAAEPDEWLARLTRRRLLLGGVDELDLDVRVGADLEERLADLDLIVTRLPYRAGETRSKLAALEAVERVCDLLGPGRTAVVLGPADALVGALPDTQEARFRSTLLRSGIVESVVTLPGGVTPYRPGYRCALWTLTRDPITAVRGFVLLADLGAEALDERVRARLAEDVLLWRAEGRRSDGHDPRYGRIVPVARLDAEFGGPLVPMEPPVSHVLARTVTERPALIAEAEGRLEQADEHARRYTGEYGRLRGGVVLRTGERPGLTTVGALIAAGRVTKVSGHRLDARHLTAEGHHPVLGPEEVIGDLPAGARRIDRAVLAGYEYAAFTEPGDLVYTLTPRLGFTVDHEGTCVVAFPARVLRVAPASERPLTPRVLAALLSAARNTGRSRGAVRPARRIEDFVLPDLDPADAARLDALLAEVERRRELLRAQDDALEEIRRLTVAGFADGTLTIDDS